MWIYKDDSGRVLALNANYMAGNSGWAQADTQTVDVDTQLYDMHGAALNKLQEGVIERRTDAERMADCPTDEPPAQTTDERLAAAEAYNIAALEAIAELYEMLTQ